MELPRVSKSINAGHPRKMKLKCRSSLISCYVRQNPSPVLISSLRLLFHQLAPRLHKADLAQSIPSHQISSRFVPKGGESAGLSSNTLEVRPVCSGLSSILHV